MGKYVETTEKYEGDNDARKYQKQQINFLPHKLLNV